MPVALRVHADRGDAETKKAGVVSSKFGFDGRKIREILVQDFKQLGIMLAGRTASNHQHALDTGVEQAFAQHALADHAGGAE